MPWFLGFRPLSNEEDRAMNSDDTVKIFTVFLLAAIWLIFAIAPAIKPDRYGGLGLIVSLLFLMPFTIIVVWLIWPRR